MLILHDVFFCDASHADLSASVQRYLTTMRVCETSFLRHTLARLQLFIVCCANRCLQSRFSCLSRDLCVRD